MNVEEITQLIEAEMLAPHRHAISVAARRIADNEHAAARQSLMALGLSSTARNRVLLGDASGAEGVVQAAISVRYLGDTGAGLMLRKAGLRVDERGDLLPAADEGKDDELGA